MKSFLDFSPNPSEAQSAKVESMKRLLLILLLIAGIAACRTHPSESKVTRDATMAASETVSAQPLPSADQNSVSSSMSKLLADLSPAQVDRATFPVNVENCGRTLTFQQPPQRVISLWQPPNELLLALGVEKNIIGFAGNYTDLLPNFAEAAQSIPSLGTATHWPSREVMLTQNPDLVISEGLEGFAFDPAAGYATVAELERNGVQVFSTGSICTPQQAADRGMNGVYDDLRYLGQIFGVSERAKVLITRLQQREAAISQRVAGRERVPTVFYNGGEGPLAVLTSGVWREAIVKAGGKPIFDKTVFQVGVEEFANSNAAVILVGFYPGQNPDQLITFLKKTFPDLPAVKSDRLYPIPTIETEAGIRIMDGLEKMARAIHPEAFEGQ
ncbi:MAG: ABC transporter substrate-binding protein [Leptolyngbyaceae cyanobacterium CRU_2_3]|nr:ABC transporter substrate-binding protein [Leptolyngbyaceae cyanobacterium CRU_2_3]